MFGVLSVNQPINIIYQDRGYGYLAEMLKIVLEKVIPLSLCIVWPLSVCKTQLCNYTIIISNFFVPTHFNL